MPKVIIDSQLSVSRHNHLHPKALKPLNLLSTTIHGVCTMNGICLARFSAFSWQFAACRSIHLFLIDIAQLPHPFSSSSFSLLRMMYYNEFSQSWRPVSGLSRELGGVMHASMQHNSRHLSWFTVRIDRTFYDLFDIADFNYVGNFHFKFSFSRVT